MFDLSVYVTIINKTNEYLRKISTHAGDGTWLNVPDRIEAKDQKSFQLKDATGWYGSDGNFDFSVRDSDDKSRADLFAFQMCPWGTWDNEIDLTKPTPEALYVATFRASVDGGAWTYGYVEKKGHPVTVEYTLQYQPKRYKFRLVHVAAVSAHPVRNSRGELIVGRHDMWDRSNASDWADGKRGSFQPNVFSYDFTSRISDAGSLEVTIEPVDLQLVGAEVILKGTISSSVVFQSDYFFIKNVGPQKVTTYVVHPATSKKPFSWNSDVEWGMELRLSQRAVDCQQPTATRLELYWIATTIHRAFNNGIPVGFMRDILKKSSSKLLSDVRVVPQAPVAPTATHSDFYDDVTQITFNDFNKIYDTVAGASAFGMCFWGGIFFESYYRAADASGATGTLYRHVNCMDQAGVLELGCSLLGGGPGARPTSWLGQQPFGFINTCHLVGVTAPGSNQLLDINNPFFGTQYDRALLTDINDQARTKFWSHVYVGHSNPFQRQTDGIYDACGGPHFGTETPAEYLAQVIDTQTNLYQAQGWQPGTVDTIATGDGVTGINGQPAIGAPVQVAAAVPGTASASVIPESATELRGAIQATLDQLIPPTLPGLSGAQASVTHVNWAHVRTWLKPVLGETWDVGFGHLTVGDAAAHAFWHLTESSRGGGDTLRINIFVESVSGMDGIVDSGLAAEAARSRLADIVGSTDRDPEVLWTPGGEALSEFGDYSVRYKDNIEAGRIVVVAGGVVVDIAGLSSSAALEGHARTLLGHTVRRDGPVLAIPVLRGGPVRTRGHERVARITLAGEEREVVTVNGVGTRFSVAFRVEGLVAAASATSEGEGVLFDRYSIHGVEEGTGGGGHAVDFMFVTRQVGRHVVRLHFAESETMTVATEVMEVEVIGA
ncbi:hypothetical protein D9615_005859 [Tricholomella constricta]|uniref:Uncharacterized protein n=1 Tax=Tricholomella constricta TaxID=117010 RepID=A0A8H5H9K2_9AGAR|nr:hypothetical protein D9615_005859 [Tricholomella constricta]